MIKYLAGLTACFVVLCAGIGYRATHQPDAPIRFWQPPRLCLVCDADASRNSSGTMSAANGPYVAGTVISPTTINSRYSDIESEITDSLSRSGKGGMTAPMRGADGTVALPAYSYTSETTSGSYRIGASDLGWAVAGAKKLELTSSLFKVTPIASFNGVLSTPAAGVTVQTASTATQSNITGAVGNNALAIESLHGVNSFLPGVIWFTSDNNATHPKAGVYAEDTAAGSVLILGTSNNYATGITANTTIDPTGILTAPGGVTIGTSGTNISGSFAGSTSWTPGSIGGGGSAGTLITATGAAVGSPCVVGAPSATGGLILSCSVTANSCNVALANATGGALTGPAGTYQCRVFNP